jgi:hypothetical protein
MLSVLRLAVSFQVISKTPGHSIPKHDLFQDFCVSGVALYKGMRGNKLESLVSGVP